MRLQLLCFLLSVGMKQSHQENVCPSIKIRSLYYQLDTLRQFPNMQPEWVKLQNGLAYYTLNGKTFNIERRQQDDVIVSDIPAPYTTSIEDEHGNKVFQREFNAYVYIAKFDREYLLVTDGQENNFKFVLDPIEDLVFILSSSNNQPYGKMFWFSLRRYEPENNSIEAKHVTDFNGSLTSIDLNPNTGNILVSEEKNSIGTVYFMKQLRKNPCANEDTPPDEIKDELLINLTKHTLFAYRDVVLKNGTIVCGENEQYSELDMYTRKPNEGTGASGRKMSLERKARACRKVKKFQSYLISSMLTIKNISFEEKNKNEYLKNKLEVTRIEMQDLANKLYRLTQTALFNKAVTGPYFNSQRSPAEVPQYETSKYVCIMRDELINKQDKLNMLQHLKVLKESLQVTEEALRLTG